MADTFFSKYPKVEYANNISIDLTVRAKIIDTLRTNPYLFYSYIIENNERADQLANMFYNDPFQNWIIYISNQILDPYYEWYLSETSFNNLIIKKYGDINTANLKIKNYRVNWFKDNSKITEDQFTLLGVNEKKYWEINESSLYQRKKLDWEINTNQVLKYWISSPINVKINDIINIKLRPDLIGKASIISSGTNQGNSYITIQHTSGDVLPNDSIILNPQSYIYTNTQQSNIQKIEILNKNITELEYKYWEPVTYLMYEIEKNEFNKSLKILNVSYIPKIVNELRTTLKEI